MTSEVEMALPINFSDSAANKVKELIAEEKNPALKLRVYVTGGGCSGFQYGFTFDEKVNEGDTVIEKNGVALVVDSLSFSIYCRRYCRLYQRSGRLPFFSLTIQMQQQLAVAAPHFLSNFSLYPLS